MPRNLIRRGLQLPGRSRGVSQTNLTSSATSRFGTRVSRRYYAAHAIVARAQMSKLWGGEDHGSVVMCAPRLPANDTGCA